MDIVGYCTPHAMRVRYSNEYAYVSILSKIRNIKYLFGEYNELQKYNYVLMIENSISKVLLKPEKEWLKDSIDFELSALNLKYCITQN